MQITIHRGINQIGGCITEVQSASGTKILIDLGHNLPDAEGKAEDEYEVPENLDRLLDGVSAVFYTHYHGDHIAFEAAVAERGVDQYLGKLAKKIKLKFYAHMQKIPQEAGREKYNSSGSWQRKIRSRISGCLEFQGISSGYDSLSRRYKGHSVLCQSFCG